MDTADRIFELVDQQYKEQRDFAADIGVKPQRVSEWRNKISMSYRKYLPQIAKTLQTSVEYLLTGEETKKVLPAQTDKEDLADLLGKLSTAELLEVIEKASARLRQLNS